MFKTFHANGRTCSSHRLQELACGDDLVNIKTKVKKEGWINIYSAYNHPKWYGESLPIQKIARQSGIYKTKYLAEQKAWDAITSNGPYPITTIKVEWEEEE